MTDALSIIEGFKNYIHCMNQSVIAEKRAVNTLIRIYGRNNEVNTKNGKLSQYEDRLDKKLEDYAAQLRLLDELENVINLAKQDQEEEKEANQ